MLITRDSHCISIGQPCSILHLLGRKVLDLLNHSRHSTRRSLRNEKFLVLLNLQNEMSYHFSQSLRFQMIPGLDLLAKAAVQVPPKRHYIHAHTHTQIKANIC